MSGASNLVICRRAGLDIGTAHGYLPPYTFEYRRNSMAKRSYKTMPFARLVALRDEVQAALAARINDERIDLQKQIDALTRLEHSNANGAGKKRVGRPRKNQAAATSGSRKPVAPKYRGPNGETWTGRGRPPRWLTGLEAGGKKREAFLIEK